MTGKPTTRESWLWSLLHEKEEKEYRKVEKMIKMKDEKGLGKWLGAFGKGKDFFLSNEKSDKKDWLD